MHNEVRYYGYNNLVTSFTDVIRLKDVMEEYNMLCIRLSYTLSYVEIYYKILTIL